MPDSAFNIARVQERAEQLRRRAEADPKQVAEVLPDLVQDLLSALEELQGVQEELRQQNEELATARLAAEAAEREWQDLFEFAPDGYLVTDLRGIVQEANRAAMVLLRVDRQFLLGKPLAVYVRDDERRAFRSLVAQLPELGEKRNWEVSLGPRAGQSLPTVMTVVVVRDLGGKPTVLRWMVRDLSDLAAANQQLKHEIEQRERAERALRESHSSLRAVIEGTTDVVFLKDPQGRYITVNAGYERLIGKPRDEIIGKDDTDLWPPEAARGFMEVDRRVLSTGEPDTYEETVIVGGAPRIYFTTKATYRDDQGRLIGLVGIARDITARKRMEAELLRGRQIESLGTLAAGIAHDFRNYLTVILGQISVGKTRVGPEARGRAGLEQAEQAALAASNLAEQLLTFAKGGAPVTETASIARLIRDSAGFALRGANVRAEPAMADDLWPVEVDKAQMSQVISNLVMNAKEAMPQGGVVQVRAENVTVDAEHPLPPLVAGRYVRIVVKDHGPGIPPEDLHRVFDPYFTTKPGGSGLGLAIAHSIVTRHQGHIAVESQPGVGTTFAVHLPASAAPVAARAPEQPATVRGAGKILVMDDEPMIRFALGAMLDRLGYQAEFAGDGARAVAIYRQCLEAGAPFDAVIMDLTIPGGMGGKEAIGRLLEIDPAAKVIVSSGYSNDPITAHFRDHGFRGIIPKPYTMERLGQVLNAVIAGRE